MKLTKINLLIMEWNNNGQWNKKKKTGRLSFFLKIFNQRNLCM